jgi:hypothetical protein
MPKLNKLSKIKDRKVAESQRLERWCPKGSTGLADQSGGLLPMLSEENYQ